MEWRKPVREHGVRGIVYNTQFCICIQFRERNEGEWEELAMNL